MPVLSIITLCIASHIWAEASILSWTPHLFVFVTVFCEVLEPHVTFFKRVHQDPSFASTKAGTASAGSTSIYASTRLHAPPCLQTCQAIGGHTLQDLAIQELVTIGIPSG